MQQMDDNITMTHDEHDDPTSSSPLHSQPSSNIDSDMDTSSDAIVATIAPVSTATPAAKPSLRLASSAHLRATARVTVPTATAATTQTSAVHQSAKMMDAQGYFQRVVKQELQVLLASGVEREVAVKMLLHRIVECTEEPEPSDVRRVMKQFQMNYDDAVRALIVKQEIGRLKRQGMDAFAAIEELTRKMQRIVVVPSDAAVNEGRGENERVAPLRLKKRSRGDRRASVGGDATGHEHQSETMIDADGDGALSGQEEHGSQYEGEDGEATVQASGECEGTAAGKGSDFVKATGETSGTTATAKDQGTAKRVSTDEATVPAIAAAAKEEEDAEASNDRNLSALSLIQRIGNVTISADRSGEEDKFGSTSTAAENVDTTTVSESSSRGDIHPGLQSPQSSRSPTSSSSSPSLFSRKRRGAFGPFGINDGKDVSYREGGSSHSSFKGEHSGPSTLPLFPSSKKQKLMVDVGDSILTMVSRKSKPPIPSTGSTSPTTATTSSPPPSSSPSPSSANNNNNNKNDNDNSDAQDRENAPTVFTVNPHKRQRESSHNPSFDKFPSILDDELSTAAHMIRLTKRRKSHQSATTMAVADQRSSSPTSSTH